MTAGPAEIRLVGPDDWMLVRSLRLAAVADAPLAFGTTYEREVSRTEGQWRERLATAEAARFVACVGEEPVGLVGVYLRTEERDAPGPVPELISMWVHPAHRAAGVGSALVDAVTAWVAERGLDEVRLMVSVDNPGAERFYERIGFVGNGYTQPFPHDPSRSELEMVRPVR